MVSRELAPDTSARTEKEPLAPSAVSAIRDAMNPDVDYEALFGPFFAERLASLLRANGALRPQTEDEVGWLVEAWNSRTNEFLAVWWTLYCDENGDWTKDSTKALRFARKCDAEAYIETIGWTEAKPTEHVWMAGGSGSTAVAAQVAPPIREAK